MHAVRIKAERKDGGTAYLYAYFLSFTCYFLLKKKRQAVSEKIFINPEDEVFQEKATFSACFALPNLDDAGGSKRYGLLVNCWGLVRECGSNLGAW